MNEPMKTKLILFLSIIAVGVSGYVGVHLMTRAASDKALAYMLMNSVDEIKTQVSPIRDRAFVADEAFDAAGMLPVKNEQALLALLRHPVKLELLNDARQPFFIYKPVNLPLSAPQRKVFADAPDHFPTTAIILAGVSDAVCRGVDDLTGGSGEITLSLKRDEIIPPGVLVPHPIDTHILDMSHTPGVSSGLPFCLRTSDQHNVFVQVLGMRKI